MENRIFRDPIFQFGGQKGGLGGKAIEKRIKTCKNTKHKNLIETSSDFYRIFLYKISHFQ